MAFIINMPNAVPSDSEDENDINLETLRRRRNINRQDHAEIQVPAGNRLQILDAEVLHREESIEEIAHEVSLFDTINILEDQADTQSDQLTSISNESNSSGNIAGRIFNSIVASQNKPVHLKSYVDLMRIFGFSSFDGDGKPHGLFRKALFRIVGVTCIYHKLSFLKIESLLFSQKGNLVDTVGILYFLQTLVESIFLFVLFSIKRIPKFLEDWPTTDPLVYTNTTSKHSICSVANVLIMLTIVHSLALTVRVDQLVHDKSVTEFVLDQAEDFAWGIFLWNFISPEDASEEITKSYAKKITTTSIVFACWQMVNVYFGLFQILIIRDLALVVVLDLHIECLKCKAKILSLQILKNDNIQELWKPYKRSFDLSERVNECFGGLLKLVHINNCLYLSYFLLRCHQGKLDWITDGIFGTVRLAKIGFFYLCCYSIGIIDEVTERHFHDISNHVFEETVEEDLKENIIIFQKKIEVYRPGVGTGFFHVDRSFFGKFAGAVLSCFLLFADTITFNQISETIQSTFGRNMTGLIQQ